MFTATLLINSPQMEKLKWPSTDEQNVVYPNNENTALKRAMKILKSPFFLNTQEGFLLIVIEMKRRNWKIVSENCRCGKLQVEKHFWSIRSQACYPSHRRPLQKHFFRRCPVQELLLISPVRHSSFAVSLGRVSLQTVRLTCASLC